MSDVSHAKFISSYHSNGELTEVPDLFYRYSSYLVEVHSRQQNNKLVSQVTIADLQAIAQGGKLTIKHVLEASFREEPILIIVTTTTPDHIYVFWHNILKKSIQLILFDQPMVGDISVVAMTSSPLTLVEESYEEIRIQQDQRHLLVFGKRDQRVLVALLHQAKDDERKVRGQVIETHLPARVTGDITAIHILTQAANDRRFWYTDPRILVGTSHGFIQVFRYRSLFKKHTAQGLHIVQSKTLRECARNGKNPITYLTSVRVLDKKRVIIAIGQKLTGITSDTGISDSEDIEDDDGDQINDNHNNNNNNKHNITNSNNDSDSDRNNDNSTTFNTPGNSYVCVIEWLGNGKRGFFKRLGPRQLEAYTISSTRIIPAQEDYQIAAIFQSKKNKRRFEVDVWSVEGRKVTLVVSKAIHENNVQSTIEDIWPIKGTSGYILLYPEKITDANGKTTFLTNDQQSQSVEKHHQSMMGNQSTLPSESTKADNDNVPEHSVSEQEQTEGLEVSPQLDKLTDTTQSQLAATLVNKEIPDEDQSDRSIDINTPSTMHQDNKKNDQQSDVAVNPGSNTEVLPQVASDEIRLWQSSDDMEHGSLNEQFYDDDDDDNNDKETTEYGAENKDERTVGDAEIWNEQDKELKANDRLEEETSFMTYGEDSVTTSVTTASVALDRQSQRQRPYEQEDTGNAVAQMRSGKSKSSIVTAETQSNSDDSFNSNNNSIGTTTFLQLYSENLTEVDQELQRPVDLGAANVAIASLMDIRTGYESNDNMDINTSSVNEQTEITVNDKAPPNTFKREETLESNQEGDKAESSLDAVIVENFSNSVSSVDKNSEIFPYLTDHLSSQHKENFTDGDIGDIGCVDTGEWKLAPESQQEEEMESSLSDDERKTSLGTPVSNDGYMTSQGRQVSAPTLSKDDSTPMLQADNPVTTPISPFRVSPPAPDSAKAMYRHKVERVSELSLSDALNMVRKDEASEFDRQQRLCVLLDIIFSKTMTTDILDVDNMINTLETLSLDSTEVDWLMEYCFNNNEYPLLKLLIMHYNIKLGNYEMVIMQNEMLKERSLQIPKKRVYNVEEDHSMAQLSESVYRTCNNLAKLAQTMVSPVVADLPLDIFGRPRGKAGNPFLGKSSPFHEQGLGFGISLVTQVLERRKKRRL